MNQPPTRGVVKIALNHGEPETITTRRTTLWKRTSQTTFKSDVITLTMEVEWDNDSRDTILMCCAFIPGKAREVIMRKFNGIMPLQALQYMISVMEARCLQHVVQRHVEEQGYGTTGWTGE